MTFKLKSGNRPGFKKMGSSPIKKTEGKGTPSVSPPPKAELTNKERLDNLLKVVPNEDAFNKLSETDKKGFTDAWEKSGGTTKKVLKKKESPAKQTDSTYADGSKKSARERAFSKRHTTEKATYNTSAKDHAKQDPYWYKIDGKKVPKHVYLKYENKPGRMEGGGKQTNNPDVYGRKEKRKADREKLRKPTVLTEQQTKNLKK
tara:strand:+ start:1676 stop:2284 length:609 start_codon:yes stop_codon:yes gene_type:complete